MKYKIHMHRRAVKTVEVFAESPHSALIMARESNPEFTADALWERIEDPDEPGEEIEGNSYEIEGGCETCGKPILTGDTYYQWDDAVQTCADCGGADEKKRCSGDKTLAGLVIETLDAATGYRKGVNDQDHPRNGA